MENVSSSNGLEKYPKLRFPGFMEPWGDIKLSDVCSYRNKRTTVSKVKYVSTENMLQNYAGLEPYTEDIETDGIAILSGDTLLANIRPYLKKVWKSEFNGACSTDVLAFSPEQINPNFLYSLIAQDKFIDYVMSGAKGSKMPRGDKTHIMDYITSIPTEKEQQKISRFVELINKRIAVQTHYIELLKKYKRGVINKLINEILLEGTPQNFANLVTIQRGGSPRPIDDYITDDTAGIHWIKIGDVSADSLYITTTKERIKPSGAKKSRKVKPGDLILSNSMSFGRPYIMKIDGCIHDGWLLIRDEQGLFDKKFLCYYLASDNVLSQYRRFAAGSCVSNLNSDLVGNLQIVLPSLKQQKKYASIFEQFDMHILNAAKQYDLLCEFKQGLLQQLFI